jgi:hypothetical protein
MMEYREGKHDGELVYALEKVTPDWAIFSRRGITPAFSIGLLANFIRLGTAGAMPSGAHAEYSFRYISSGRKSTMFGFL